MIDITNPSAGIMITYGGGDRCVNSDNKAENGLPRKAQFKIYCADKQDENVNLFIKFKVYFRLT